MSSNQDDGKPRQIRLSAIAGNANAAVVVEHVMPEAIVSVYYLWFCPHCQRKNQKLHAPNLRGAVCEGCGKAYRSRLR